jgi:hypothetical protein
MKDLLKYTYLLDTKNIKKSIENLWDEYQEILGKKNLTWEDLNEARAILYFIGYLYPEKIALESLEKRIKFIKPSIGIDEFLLAIDGNDAKILKKYAKNKKFNKLKDLYLIVKGMKNRIKGRSYLDEKKFNEIFKKMKPKNYF